MPRPRARWLLVVTHVGALAPLAALAWMAWQDQLGPAPVAAAIRLLGRYALVLLLFSLVPSVVRTTTGSGKAMLVRRPLGLYAFLYASLHALAFVGLDFGFALSLVATTVLQSRREILGVLALGILSVLALTSLPSLMRRLGGTWKWLHRLVYVAAGLVVAHYIWNYKELRTWPALSGAVLFVLLVTRVPPIARLLAQWRSPQP